MFLEKPDVVEVENGMEEFFSAADSTDALGLWVAYRAYFHAQGITQMIGIYIPPIGMQGGPHIRVEEFSVDWAEDYIGGLYADDPILAHAMTRPMPFRWSEIRGLRTLTAAQQSFMERFDQICPNDGLVLPAFGPNGHNGYTALALPDHMQDVPGMTVRQWHIVAQYAHLRYCEFMQQGQGEFQLLSPRELEVLGWVARGKSNSVIADIIGVSSNTVDTHLRRIYNKLHVTDRVTAALVGLGMGIISVH
jgi:DNA-binding CsgD family transcriptional regulator